MLESDGSGTFGRCFLITESGNNTITPLKQMTNIDAEYYDPAHPVDSFGWSSAISGQEAIVGGPATHRSGALVYEDVRKDPIPIFSGTDSNLGYSVAIGNFFKKTEPVYALGAPYGDHGVGKVVFYEKRPGATFSSSEENNGYFRSLGCSLNDPGVPGSMFASVMCTANLDGDGRADLLVGAPTYSAEDKAYEVGAVYVFYGIECSSSAEPRGIKGSQTGGRFGMAIANIGDMDNDNIDDIVIAAPYEDDGRGAIYLYPGATFLASSAPKPCQRIQPSDKFRHFGFSLALIPEYDAIGSSGLAVGGFGNKNVAFLRYVPTFQINIQANEPDFQKQSELRFTLSSCFNFTFPRKPKKMSASVEMTMEIIHQHAKLVDSPTRSKTIDKTTPLWCETFEVDMPTAGNYTTQPIEYRIQASQKNDPLSQQRYNSTEARLFPAPDRLQKVLWKLECPNGKCEPNLTLVMQATISNPYLVGSTNYETLELKVTNSKATDPASHHCARLCASAGVTLRPGGSCSRDHSRNGCLMCLPNKLLTTQMPWDISHVALRTTDLTSNITEVNVKATVLSNCTDEATATEAVVLRVKLTYDQGNVTVRGANEAGQHIIKVNETELNNKGRSFKHEYTVINNGRTTWIALKCTVELDPRPYLIYEIEMADKGACVIEQPYNHTGKFNMSCVLDRLEAGSHKVIQVKVLVKNFHKGLFDKNVTVTSRINIEKLYQKSKSVETILVPVKTVMELWITIVSCVTGFILLTIIAFSLYKCGFLKRKKKGELAGLIRRESIRRQSLRQSALDQRVSRTSAQIKRTSAVGNLPQEVSQQVQGFPGEGDSISVVNQRHSAVYQTAGSGESSSQSEYSGIEKSNQYKPSG